MPSDEISSGLQHSPLVGPVCRSRTILIFSPVPLPSTRFPERRLPFHPPTRPLKQAGTCFLLIAAHLRPDPFFQVYIQDIHPQARGPCRWVAAWGGAILSLDRMLHAIRDSFHAIRTPARSQLGPERESPGLETAPAEVPLAYPVTSQVPAAAVAHSVSSAGRCPAFRRSVVGWTLTILRFCL